MLLKKAVIDASVAVKWFSEEPYSRRAERILRDISAGTLTAASPDLLPYEAGNALWKGKQLDIQRIISAFEIIFDSGIEFVPLDKHLAEYAARLMVTYDLTFYDAVYGALAYLRDIPLITANPKDHQKIREIKVINIGKYAAIA